MSSESAEVKRLPIYYVAGTLGRFLFESLCGNDDDLELWEFFVSLCCCVGLRMRMNEKEGKATFFIQDVTNSNVKSAFFLPGNKAVKWHDLSTSFKTVAERGMCSLKEVSVDVSTMPYTVVLEEGFFDDCDMLEDICTLKDVIATTVFSKFPKQEKKVNRVKAFLQTRKSK